MNLYSKDYSVYLYIYFILLLYFSVAARISGCLADISACMKEHHLQLNMAKTELLVFPATTTLQHDFTIQLGSSTITPSASVRNLDVIFDDRLTFKEHIAKTARSCRFALHNIRKSGPFWQSMLHNFMSRPLSELPSLQDIYTRRCIRKARRIIKDFSHPSHSPLSLLPSERRLRCIRYRTSRLRDSFFPQAIRLMNSKNEYTLQHTPTL